MTPASEDAEKGLLGSVMYSPDRILDLCEERRVTTDWFHTPALATVYQVTQEMRAGRKPVDLVSLTQQIRDKGLLAQVGGPAAVTELFNFVPTAANAPYYLEILLEKFQRRQAIDLAERILAAARDASGGENISEVAQAGLLQIAGLSESKAVTKHIRDIILRRLDYYEEIRKKGAKLEGIPTGIAPLDRMIRGLRPGNVIVIAAQTKGGKTTLALNFALNAAEVGSGVGIFSLEMSEGELADALLAAKSGMDFSMASEEGMKEREMRTLIASAHAIAECSIFVRDESVLTPNQFRAAARKLCAESGCRLLVVDYLQLMEPGSSDDNRERQVANSSRIIKTTASELGVPIIVLSQLNDHGRSRESRAIEQDSNIFAVIEEDDEGHWINVKLARDCRTGRVPVTFRKESRQFVERINQ